MFLESFVITGFFVPGAVLTVIMGGLSARGYFGFWTLTLLCTLGTFLGDSVSYELGRRRHDMLDRWPRVSAHLKRAQDFFRAHPRSSIFLGRFFSWTRPIMPFVGGMSSMSRMHFYLADIATCFLWSFFHLGLGYLFGTAWSVALLWSTRALFALLIVVVLLALFVWLWRLLIHYGRKLWPSILASLLALRSDVLQSPFGLRHPRLVRWFFARFNPFFFTGLPLTMLVVFIAVLGLSLLGAVEDVVSGEPITQLDLNTIHLAYALRSPELLAVSYVVTLFGNTSMIIAGGILLSVFLLLRRQRIEALVLWATLLIAELVINYGKLAFHRARPGGLLPTLDTTTYSFPSGHSLGAMVFYGFVAYLVLRSGEKWGTRASVLMSAMLLILLIGLSRILLGLHYPSDVLAGYAAGLIILLWGISMCEWLHSRRDEQRLTTAAGGVSILALCVCLLVAHSYITHPPAWKVGVTMPDHLQNTTEPFQQLFDKSMLPPASESLLGNPTLPMNIAFVGDESCISSALQKEGFVASQPVDWQTFLAIFHAALLQQPYPAAPLTPSFAFGEPQELGFTKLLTTNGRTRLQLRIWPSPLAAKDGRIFAASAVVMERRPGLLTRRSIQSNTAREEVLASLKKETAKADIVLLPKSSVLRDRVTSDGRVYVLTLRPCAAAK